MPGRAYSKALAACAGVGCVVAVTGGSAGGALPTVPELPQAPAVPELPQAPAVPSVPELQPPPELPSVPAVQVPSVPEVQAPSGSTGQVPATPRLRPPAALNAPVSPAGVVTADTPGGSPSPGASASAATGGTGRAVAAGNNPSRRDVRKPKVRERRLRRTVRRLETCLHAVSPFERRVLTLRAGLDSGRPSSRARVARRLEVHASTVRKMERNGLRSLREADDTSGCGGDPTAPDQQAALVPVAVATTTPLRKLVSVGAQKGATAGVSAGAVLGSRAAHEAGQAGGVIRRAAAGTADPAPVDLVILVGLVALMAVAFSTALIGRRRSAHAASATVAAPLTAPQLTAPPLRPPPRPSVPHEEPRTPEQPPHEPPSPEPLPEQPVTKEPPSAAPPPAERVTSGPPPAEPLPLDVLLPPELKKGPLPPDKLLPPEFKEEPPPPAPSPPPQHTVVRRRTGGLVGRIRSRLR